MAGSPKGQFTREAYRDMWRAVKAFVSDDGYESIMDDLTVTLTEPEWNELNTWIDIARGVLDEVKASGAKPLPLIRERTTARMRTSL